MQESLRQYYSRLAGFLRTVTLRLQLFFALELFFLLGSAFLLVLLGSFFPLQLQESFPHLPFLYSLGSLAFFIYLMAKVWSRILPRPSAEQVARKVEEKFPRLRDDITNSLLLYREMEKKANPGLISPGLIAAQVKKTVQEVSSIPPEEVVSFRGTLRHLKLFLPLVLALGGVITLDPQFLNRSLALVINPLSSLPHRATSISVEPGESILLRGKPLTIRARATGNLPQKLSLLILPEGQDEMHFSMEPEGEGRFAYRLAQAQFSFRYQAYFDRVASPLYSVRVVDPPDIRRVRVALFPPDYTRLPQEVKEGGHVEALKGTTVELEGETTPGVIAAEMILSQEPPLSLEVQGDRLKGSWLVLHPGVYSLRVRDEFGFENPNPVPYQVRVLPDHHPEAEILLPAEDLEVSGGEEIPLVYRVRDDFGITGLKLIGHGGGKEISIDLKISGGLRSSGPQVFRWDLTTLALAGGEKVTYRLAVWDNDTVSGPKVGYSRTFTLSVRDHRARALQEGEEAQRIADDLLTLLADQLEETKDREALTRRMEEILKKIDRNLERRKDRADNFDLEGLRRNLASLKERMPTESKETITQEMERLALLAEDLVKRARMDELEALAREIKNRQRRLIDSLKELKGPLSQEKLEAILKELKKLAELLRSMMEALSRMIPQLPDEFVNSPELSGLDFQDLLGDLEEIQKKLMAGDLAGALEAAQRLFQSLSEMMASLGRASSQVGMSALDKLQGEMSRQAGELDKILEEQIAILRETEKIDREVRERVKDKKEGLSEEEKEKFPPLTFRQENLKGRTEGLHEKLEMLAQLFPGLDTEILKDLKEAARSMGIASSKLKEEDAPGAIPPEQEVLRRLSRSQQGMKQMAQQMAMRMQAARWGRPWGYDPRPGWYYGPWIPMPTLPQPEVKRPLERGFTGLDREEFDPPSKDAYRVPQTFREKVLEALKEEVPSSYKKDVERYFRGLTE